MSDPWYWLLTGADVVRAAEPLLDDPPFLATFCFVALLAEAKPLLLRLADDPPFLAPPFFADAFLGVAFFGAAFFGADFLGAAFFATPFFAPPFLAPPFFGADFFAPAFLAVAFFKGDFFAPFLAPPDEPREDFLEAPFLAAFLEAPFFDLPPPEDLLPPFFPAAAFLVDFAIVMVLI
jgi:hypothetical protein